MAVEDTLTQALDEVWDCVDEGEAEEALARLDDLPRADARVQAARGAALLVAGDEEAGREALRRATASDPAPLEALLELGWHELERDDPTAAGAVAERALRRATTPSAALPGRRGEALRGEVHVLRLHVALALGPEPAVLELVASAAEAALGAAHGAAQLTRGAADVHAGRFAEAAAPLRAALEVASESALGNHLLGLCLERAGAREQAEACFLRAAELDPELYCAPTRLDDAAFDLLVEEALDDLPPDVREELLACCTIVREDYPSAERVRAGADPYLLGECVGTAADHRAGDQAPAHIVLYRRNLERECATLDELEEEVRVTLFHEAGHALGLDEDGVAELGLA